MDMVHLSVGSAAIIVLLGMGVVFLGLFLLMIVVKIMSKIMMKHEEKAKTATTAQAKVKIPLSSEIKTKAPGSAGELKLYDTDPRDAAMIMAIVADELGKPLNELRFKSIREIK